MKKFREVESAHLGTTTGSRLCPKDQPQQVRMPRVAELSENAWPRRAAAAGAPHTAAVRSRAFGGGIRCAPPRLWPQKAVAFNVRRWHSLHHAPFSTEFPRGILVQ